MKSFWVLTLVAGIAVLSGCQKKDDNNNGGNGNTVAATPDTYCLSYGYYSESRCNGYRYWTYGDYNYGGNNWSQYQYYSNNSWANNNTYGGCGAYGSAPVYGNSGLACYQLSYDVSRYYWWSYGSSYNYGGYNGFLIGCSQSYACPGGLACSNSRGAGVCIYP